MGRNRTNESGASKVISARKILLENINKSQSLGELERLEKIYKTDSRYAMPTSSSNLPRNRAAAIMSLGELRELTSLATQITEAFEAQKNKLTCLVHPEAESSSSLVNVGVVDDESELEESILRYDEEQDEQALLFGEADGLGIDESGQLLQSPFQQQRRVEVNYISIELINVAKKCERMSKKGPAYEKATLATQNIHREITNLVEQYVQDGDVQHFQDQTKALFDETSEDMKTINEHRGWAKNFFGNLAFFILGGGVGYAVVCAYRGKFFEFNTDTANVVGAVNEKISALSIS